MVGAAFVTIWASPNHKKGTYHELSLLAHARKDTILLQAKHCVPTARLPLIYTRFIPAKDQIFGPVDAEFRVNTHTASYQFPPAVADEGPQAEDTTPDEEIPEESKQSQRLSLPLVPR